MENTKDDVIFKEFWRSNERFADLFNVVVFGGKEVIKPDALQEMDTDVSSVIQMKDYKETLTRTRDVIKKAAYGVEFVVMGIESQQYIHYAMPLRHMVYDAMSYLKEYQEITRRYKKEKEKTTEETSEGTDSLPSMNPTHSNPIIEGIGTAETETAATTESEVKGSAENAVVDAADNTPFLEEDSTLSGSRE